MPEEICVAQLMKGWQVSGRTGGRGNGHIWPLVKSSERGQRLPSEAQFIFEPTINKVRQSAQGGHR